MILIFYILSFFIKCQEPIPEVYFYNDDILRIGDILREN